MICTVSGEQAEHGFDTKTTLQVACETAVGTAWNLRMVGGKAHDVVPIIVLQLRKMIAVQEGVVCKDRVETVLLKPDTQISNRLDSGAENGPHRRFNEQCAFVHAANSTLNG